MDINDIFENLQYSVSAYNDITDTDFGECITRINDIESGVQCYLGFSPPLLRIAFRGTDDDTDRISNLRFCKKKVPYGNESSRIRMHSGFVDSYKSVGVRGVIHRAVSDDIKSIRLTGHSLGAALAVVCAVDLQYNFPDRDIELVVFGCPRVGNRAFAKSYERRVPKSLRVVNGRDIITKLPLSLMGYRHVGAKLRIGRRRLLSLGINDHRQKSYYSRLVEKML